MSQVSETEPLDPSTLSSETIKLPDAAAVAQEVANLNVHGVKSDAPEDIGRAIAGATNEVAQVCRQMTEDEGWRAFNALHNMATKLPNNLLEGVSPNLKAIGHDLYGETLPEMVDSETVLTAASGKRADMAEWSGAPINLVLGDLGPNGRISALALERDGNGRWYMTKPEVWINHKAAQPIPEAGLSLGRKDIDERNDFISRNHLVLRPQPDGKIEIHDVSSNGTKIVRHEYPRPNRAAAAEQQREGMLAKARKKLGL